MIEHLRKGWAGDAAFEPAHLVVETLQCGELFLTPEPGLRNRRFQHPDRLVVNDDRHRKGMPVFAVVRDGKPRRVGKPVGRAMDDFGDHR